MSLTYARRLGILGRLTGDEESKNVSGQARVIFIPFSKESVW